MTDDTEPSETPDTGASPAEPGETSQVPEGEPVADEERLRAELEDEIRKVKVEDVLLQSVISVLNLSARRIAKDDERDLEQAKLGIDASRAVVEFLPGEAQDQVREALSELQMLYAKHASGQAAPESGEASGEEKSE